MLSACLPKVDGLAVLEAIRGNGVTRAVPVVILTNLDEEDLRAAGAQLGVSDWLIKSQVTPGGVSARVADWADTRPKVHPPVGAGSNSNWANRPSSTRRSPVR